MRAAALMPQRLARKALIGLIGFSTVGVERIQEEMAHVLGISLRYLGSIERSEVSPIVTLLGKFPRALKMPACDLITPMDHEN